MSQGNWAQRQTSADLILPEQLADSAEPKTTRTGSGLYVLPFITISFLKNFLFYLFI